MEAEKVTQVIEEGLRGYGRFMMIDQMTMEEITSRLTALRFWYHWFILALAFLFGWQVAEALGWSL